MSGETLERDVAAINNEKAIAEFSKAFQAALTLRSDFGRKKGYVREKEPDEQAFHQVKSVFGEFRPFNRELMEKNTNDGKGAEVKLPDGQSVHIKNQAELFDKIVAFNKERGDFYDERLIAQKSPKDYERLKDVNAELDHKREALIKSYPKKSEAFKNISSIEKEVKAQFDADKVERKAKRNSQPKKETGDSPAKKTEKEPVERSENVSKQSMPAANIQSAPHESPQESVATNADSNVKMNERPVAAVALDSNVPVEWVKEQDDRANAHMRHSLLLSFLQEERFSVERDHFYNEMHKQLGKQITTVQDADEYIASLMNSRQADSILRDTAPGAVAAVNHYINEFDIDQTLKSAGYSPDRITPEFKEKTQISEAYASRIGGEVGRKAFLDALREHKDTFMRGAGDARVGLAISGTLLGMGIIAGTGPAGIVIGGIKFANKLLETESGKQFQRSLYESSVKFLAAVGVDPNIINSVNSSIQDLWAKTAGSRWGKVAMFGVMAVSAIALGPSAVDVTHAHTHAANLIDQIKNLTTMSDVPSVDIPTGSHTNSILPSHSPAIQVQDTPALTDHAVEPKHHIPVNVGVGYDIKSGDTLWNIAKNAYSQTHPGEVPTHTQIINLVNQIAEHNDISDPNKIYSGKIIDIPANLTASSEKVIGPTDWMTGHLDHSAHQSDHSHSVNRLEGLNERSQEWRQENKVELDHPVSRGIRV